MESHVFTLDNREGIGLKTLKLWNGYLANICKLNSNTLLVSDGGGLLSSLL